MVIHNYLLFQNHYGTEKMRQIWSEDNMVQKWLDAEEAIVVEMASLNLIPQEVAEEISKKSSVEHLTPEMIADSLSHSKHIGVALVQAFAKMCGPAAEYYHLGLTTQDILLTGLTLQMKEAYDEIVAQLLQLQAVLIEQAKKYKNTPMIGRTHGQHAVPLTFGFTLASWAYEIQDHYERLQELSKRLFRAKFTAAVGTRNTWVYLFGVDKTQELVGNAAQRLGLDNPPIDIQTRTDRLSEIAFCLANLIGSLGKIGLNIRHLNSEEIGEVEEPWDYQNQYSSSTMPNKRNPESSEWTDGLANIAAGNASALLGVTILSERDATRMGPVFKCISDNFLLASSALSKSTHIISGLTVNEEKMLRNIHLTNGLVMAEAVMLKLWQKTAKKVTAHALVRDISVESVKQNIPFKQAILKNPEVMEHLSLEEVEEVLNPDNYSGDAAQQVDRLFAYIEAANQPS